MTGPAPEQVLPVVLGIIERVTNRSHPGADLATPLEDLDGVDSLRLLETVALAEEHFGVAVDTGGFGSLATLGDIVGMIVAARPG